MPAVEMVDMFMHEYIALRLVQKSTESGGIPGKKALQKILYFFNLEHNCFYYRWAHYGPFSGEIQQAVSDFVYKKKIKVEEIQTRKPGAVIQRMTYQNEDTVDFQDFPPKFDKTLDSVMEFTRGKSPRELELLASVHFLADMQKDQSGSHDANFIYTRLSALKPDAGFTREDVSRSLKILEGEGLLRHSPNMSTH